MKETGLLLSTPMVKATLEDRKTCTRRVILPQPKHQLIQNAAGNWRYADREGVAPNSPTWKCPYGQVGDLLYIKETHYKYGLWELTGEKTATGKPEWEFISLNDDVRYYDNPPSSICKGRRDFGWFKRPSIFMFKKDARLWLKITGVRDERLWEIDSWDCIHEGIRRKELFHPHGLMIDKPNAQLISEFQTLWDSLNAERGYGWDTNPMVWPIDYKRVVK